MTEDASAVLDEAIAWVRAAEPPAALLARWGSQLGYEVGGLWVRKAARAAPEAIATWHAHALDGVAPALVAWAHAHDDAAATDALTIGEVRSALVLPLGSADESTFLVGLFARAVMLPPDGTLVGFARVAGLVCDRIAHQVALARLSERQLDVLRLVARGQTNVEIAAALFLSPATVKTHLTHIYARLGVSDRAEAVANAARAGVIG